jgi:hypothetical protein
MAHPGRRAPHPEALWSRTSAHGLNFYDVPARTGLQGRVYKPNGGDILDILGFVGNIGAGGFYIVTRAMDWARCTGTRRDYGKSTLSAGLLNFISVADAYHIAIGKKQ